jgi:transposase
LGWIWAKTVFQVHGVDERGKTVLRKVLKRAEVMSFFARLVPCLVGMEACGCAHFWGRKLSELGHTVKLMAPQFVKPYVKSNKNDARDAEAICEAVSRPNMRFVALKTAEQQALIAIHRARQGFVSARTAQSNQLRGLLSELGIVMPKGISTLQRRMPQILEDAENGLLVVVVSCLRACTLISKSWIGRWMNLRGRSKRGTVAISPAGVWRRFLE